jgi:hypothetical protein
MIPDPTSLLLQACDAVARWLGTLHTRLAGGVWQSGRSLRRGTHANP